LIGGPPDRSTTTIETAPVRPSGTRWAWVVGLAAALTVGLALYGRWSSPPTSPAALTAGTPAGNAALSSPSQSPGAIGSGGPQDLPQPILASAPVGAWPVDLAFGFGSVWVVDVGDGSLSSLDLRTGQFKRAIGLGGGPIALAVDDDWVWVAQRQAHTIARIEPLFDVQLAPITLSGAPVDVAAGAGSLWVAIEDDAVLRIDSSTDQVVATIAVPDRPRSVVFAAGSVWVASRWAGTVTRIDPATNTVVESWAVPGADRLVATSDAVWVVNALSCGLGICGRNGQLYRLDGTTGDLTEGVASVGLVTPGAGGLWAVALGSNTLLRIDHMTGLPTSRASLGLERLPTALLETPGSLWIADAAQGRVLQVATAGGP
jgi:virginiamycin B lyase